MWLIESETVIVAPVNVFGNPETSIFEVAPVVELSGIETEVLFVKVFVKLELFVVVKLTVLLGQTADKFEEAAIAKLFPMFTTAAEEDVEHPVAFVTVTI